MVILLPIFCRYISYGRGQSQPGTKAADLFVRLLHCGEIERDGKQPQIYSQ